jgi:crotonobetainyl-CoA:carnitine CoA-transferase CaiB-like acyl-CoA transferase
MENQEKVLNGRMPLEGIRVLDASIFQAGPVASALLGDMGADVIKIEEPTSGDLGRYFQILGTDEPEPPFAYFENNNRSKRSLAINLKKEKAREVIYRLAKRSDIFLSNFKASALERLGLGYDSLLKHNPRIIYAVGYGYGKKGPHADQPSLDLAAQARGGIMSITSGNPGWVGGGMADQLTGLMLAYGIMTALFVRERTGIGQEVDVSMLGSQTFLGSIMLQLFLFRGDLSMEPNVLMGQNRGKVNNPLYNVYRCKDDRWICLAGVHTDPYWSVFCKATGLEDLEKDSRFDSHENRTKVNGRELIAILDEVFATKPSTEWVEILGQPEMMPVAQVQNYADVSSDPQVLANDYVVEVDHPTAGRVKVVGLPVKLSKTPGRIRSTAPELGQHTEEILLDVGGYSWEEISDLRNDGVI